MIEQLSVFFIVFVAIAAVLANLSVWAPRKTWVRCAAVALVTLFIPAAYASLADLLSRPKPVSIEWVYRNATEATVLGARIVEGKSIYLWLQLPGEAEPRAYVLPYDKETAKQLHQAQGQAKKNGTRLRMRRPFNKDYDDTAERQFFAPPQPRLPTKSSPKSTPYVLPQSPNNTKDQ